MAHPDSHVHHPRPLPTSGPAPFEFSPDTKTDFRKRFAAYRLAVATHPIGTTKEGVHGSRYIELQKFLGHLRDYWTAHGLSWSCLQSTDAQGRVTTQHVWVAEDGMCWTPPMVGSMPAQGDSPQQDGVHRTYAARRTLLMIHGCWPDGDYDGLTAMEAEHQLQQDAQNLVPGAKPVQPDQAPEAQAGADKAPEDAEAAWIFDEGMMVATGEFPNEKASMQSMMVLWRATFNPAETHDDLATLQTLVNDNWGTFKGGMSSLGVQGMQQRLNKMALTTPADSTE